MDFMSQHPSTLKAVQQVMYLDAHARRQMAAAPGEVVTNELSHATQKS